MGRRLVLLVVIAAVIVAAVAWQAPATLVSTRVERLLGHRVTLANSGGTVWNGHGTLVTSDARLPLRWRVHPQALLRGELAVTIAPDAPGANAPRADIVATEHGSRIHSAYLELPASALIDAAVPRPRMDAAGTVSVDATDLEWPLARSSTGAVNATWRDARIGVAGSEKIDLGDIGTQLRMQQGTLTGPITNTHGEFAIAGTLTVLPGGAGTIAGVVRPRRPDDPRTAALRALGAPEGDGVRLEWRWPAP